MSESNDEPTAQQRRTMSVLSALIVVMAVIAIALAVVLITKDDKSGSGTTAAREERKPDRVAAITAASEFVEISNTYAADDLIADGTLSVYRDRLLELVTPELKPDIEDVVERAEETVAESGFARTAIVEAADVALLQEDAATVFVTATLSTTSEGGEAETQKLRFAVDLKRADTTWLVNDMQAFAS